MTAPVKIVYMGTPDFAVPPLNALHKAGYDISLVVTQPDRKKGRGRKLSHPPVKQAAMALGIEVVQPEKINTDPVISKLKAASPDYFVVAAYGHILPKKVLDIPLKGAINIHASLLPKYRGSAPIHRAVINGEKQTGITTMLMDQGMDTGDMLMCDKTDILPHDTTKEVHDRLSLMGARLIVGTLEKMEQGILQPKAQDHSKATYAPMLKKNEGRINWEMPAKAIESFIRGMSPWPGAFTFCGDRRFKIHHAKIIEHNSGMPPGTILSCMPGELQVAAKEGTISILEIQEASGKRMPVDCFLCGCELLDGEIMA